MLVGEEVRPVRDDTPRRLALENSRRRSRLSGVLLALAMLATSGCGQAVLAHKLDALNARFENRLRITHRVLPPAVVGKPYSARLSASGGTAPYFWKIMGGDLPVGLSLEGASGVITGVPTQSVQHPIVVQVSDSSRDPKNYVYASISFDSVGGGVP